MVPVVRKGTGAEGSHERKENEKKIAEANFSDTGYSYTLSLISGKYKPIILYCLMEYEPVRFNEMQRYLGKVADKTLSQNLKELEKDGLIHREMYPVIPRWLQCWTSSATGVSKTAPDHCLRICFHKIPSCVSNHT